MRCHSVACGMANQTQSAMQLATRSIAAAHMTLVIRVYDDTGNTIETVENVSRILLAQLATQSKKRLALRR
jgi:hypothetical protein